MTDYPKSPFVLKKCLLNWKTFQRWSPEYIAQSTLNNKVTFKIGKRNVNRENIQKYFDLEISETFQNFIDWCKGVGKSKFSEIDINNDWAYCSYEYVNDIFKSWPVLIDDIDWTFFGLPESMKNRSVFWMGSVGSFTDCHFDTYGCNLVCQIRGNKKWLLFPPEDTKYLYPTRIPYEESSVYSSIDFNNPNLSRFPRLMKATPYVVTLGPGDALFVPRHWWHFVKTEEADDECSLSINLWIDDPHVDDENRILEALSKVVTYSFLDSSFLPSLPPGALADKEEFLDGDWGVATVVKLNDLLMDRPPAKERVTLEGVFDNFDGEKVESCKWDDVFSNGTDYFDDRSITGLDVIDCFTHPEVINAVRRVLGYRTSDYTDEDEAETIINK